jgi:hypothetical protein
MAARRGSRGFLAAGRVFGGAGYYRWAETRVKPSTKIATTRDDQQVFDQTTNRPGRQLVGLEREMCPWAISIMF